MKPKPVSHKNSNTFKFESFAKQLENIDVSIFRRDLPPSPDGKNSYFWEAFEKWRDLDYSKDYDDFRKDIGDEIVILEQVALRKDEIAQVLTKHLDKEGSLALPAILELTVALARDLRMDFYNDHFKDIFLVIIKHLMTKDTELLEKLFICLAYLFKFLWSYMLKDFENAYRLFAKLLCDKDYIRTFACMSFAFLVRKIFTSKLIPVNAKEGKVVFIFKELQEVPQTSAKHIINLLMNALQVTGEIEEKLSLITLKKYIADYLSSAGARLSEEAAEKLINHCVYMRSSNKENQAGENKSNVSITVRQLEAIIRIAEALSEIELKPFASERHVDEAIRIFRDATDLAGAEGFTTQHQMLIEKQVSDLSIVQDVLQQQTFGVGQLCFEVIKGVKEQFHSCTEKVFDMLLWMLGKEGLSPDLIEQSLLHMLTSMANHTVQKHCFVVQKIFCDVISRLISQSKELDDSGIKHLDRLLHLLSFWIKFKRGKLVTSEDSLLEVLVKLCNISCLPEFCMQSLVEIISSVMLSRCLEIPMGKINLIVSQIYMHSDDISILFTKNMFSYGMFEKDILPVFFCTCLAMLTDESESRKNKALDVLSEAVTSLKPVIASGEDIKSFSKLYLCINPSKMPSSKTPISYETLEDYLIQILQQETVAKEHLSKVWSALVCLPHVRCLKIKQACQVLSGLAERIKNILLSSVFLSHQDAEEFCFVLCQTYFAMLILDAEETKTAFSLNFFTDLLKKFPASISILRMVDYYMNSSCNVTIEDLPDVLSIVIPNLASPFHLVRMFTLRILKNLDHQMQQPLGEFKSVFAICFEAESIPLEVQSYREKLKWLRKLEHAFIEKDMPLAYEELLKKACIYYLLGMLYVNFKLLWEPAQEILETFAHGTTKLFWEVFSEHLNNTIELCEKCHSGVDTFEMLKWKIEDVGAYHQNLKKFCEPIETPDVINHRLLLWKSMELFSDVVEAKNKTIVPLLLQFMVNEVVKADTLMASTESVNKHQEVNDSQLDIGDELENLLEDKLSKRLKRKRKIRTQSTSKKSKLDVSEVTEEMDVDVLDATTESVDQENEDSEFDESDGEDLEEEVEEDLDSSMFKKSKKKRFATRRFHVAKTLCGYLSVFAKFKNPKGGFKADELQQLYNQLLSHHDPLIQKLAFDCILTFNLKYLNPYKDNFYRILDNKTFKTEVVLFNLDTENKVIQEEHRMGTLSVLMRILYGKMLYKTGGNTSGKNLANARRSLVLRFLAGCKAQELKMFLELAFVPFKDQMNDDTHIAVKKIKDCMDLSSIVPIRRQHSALNTLGLILQHLGNLVPDLLPYLLKVLLIITATSTTLLEKRTEVLPQCINLLKSVRTLAVMKLIQFFKSFDDYKFTPEEIDAIFDSIVWPMLPRLVMESVNQPSPLLRLFATWSDNPRYYILFAKHHESCMSLVPIRHIIDLYASEHSKGRVVGVISKIVFQLLTSEEKIVIEEDAKHVVPISINNCLSLPDISIDNVPCNLGNKLVQPYVDKVLKRFQMTVARLGRKKFKSLPRDFNILLSISKFVGDPVQSFKLIQLLPPFLLKPKADSESEVLILTTISSLLTKSENPEYFIKLFAPLFGRLSNQNSRRALVRVFCTIAEIKPEMKKLAEIVSKVNSYDPNSLGEPDYQLRLDGHKETLNIVKQMDEHSFNEDFIRIVIFNSSHMIRMCDDIALRSSSSYMLQELSKILSTRTDHSSKSILLYGTLLPEIQKGFKNQSEAVRHEFISVLSAILHSWENEAGLKDLVMLCHEDKDLDFWENIRHLQVHRRARALLRFANIIKEQCENKEKVPLQYLLSYMIPIVASFLFDSSYKKHVHVIDAAIETLGCIALALPWLHYEPLLKKYLQQLSTDAENHKTIIKIIVSLLNSFHFKPIDKKDTSITDTTTEELEGNVNSNKLNETSLGESYKIYHAIKKNILPLLHRSLMKKTKSDDEHKLSGHYYPEDEEILRVPIALAMVKLLQNLPSESLKKNLPGLLLRMCDLLKSKTESIRETTRETLLKMMESLGPKHFRCLLSEMKGVMKRGYQVHVMTFTVNAVLTRIAPQMEPGNLDDCTKDLTDICMIELFSDMAEEKEVQKITGKLKEARSVKSYYIFEILSKYVSENFVLEMIKPLKEALSQKQSHKVMKKVSECLRHIAVGLSDNKCVANEKQLIFIHAIINESMPGLNKKKKLEAAKPKFERADCFLIPKEPGRSGPPAKINERNTDHVFVEFGLQLFSYSLKKDKIVKDKKEILEMLDPFVPILSDCLASNHMKIITTSLRCLLPLYKYSLPSFKTVTKKIVDSLFILVNKYAAVGMGQGENFEMIVMCFKVFTVLVRDTSYHTLSDEQLQSLLSYIEQDIYDYTRQATAFTLLRAVLSKKLQAGHLKGIMSKIAEMSITSEQEYVRVQCRQVCLQYMLDYPLGKQLVKSLSFFIAQLEYDHEHGRVSSLEMINSMLNNFPENVLQKHSALFLVPLAARLVNDESPGCRKMAAQCIKRLLTKVQHDGRLGLFSIAQTWLQAKKLSHKRLGAQLCGLFAEVEGEQFEHHLQEVLPVITELISLAKTEEEKSQANERSTDHFLFHILNSLIKMLGCCTAIKKSNLSDSLNLLWVELQSLILYPHLWVRLATSQLFGLMLSSYTVEEIQKAIVKKKKSNSVFLNSKQKLRDLSADFSTQLQSPYLNEKLGEQVVRNLVYLARVISTLPEKSSCEEDTVEVTLGWMIRKLCREAKKEVAEHRTVSQRRKCVFTFMAAFAHELGKEKLMPLLSTMLVPLCREISDGSTNADADLKKYAQEVLDLIKTIVGVEDFATAYADIQTNLFKRKVERKREKKQEAVTNPEAYAQKRIKKQQSKKDSKKRKIVKLRSKKKVKKSKLSDLVIAT